MINYHIHTRNDLASGYDLSGYPIYGQDQPWSLQETNGPLKLR